MIGISAEKVHSARPPTPFQLAEYLASVPVTAQLIADLNRCDRTFERVMELIHAAVVLPDEGRRIREFRRAESIYAAWTVALAELVRICLAGDGETLWAGHAAVLALGVEVGEFLVTSSGTAFADWLEGRA